MLISIYNHYPPRHKRAFPHRLLWIFWIKTFGWNHLSELGNPWFFSLLFSISKMKNMLRWNITTFLLNKIYYQLWHNMTNSITLSLLVNILYITSYIIRISIISKLSKRVVIVWQQTKKLQRKSPTLNPRYPIS